MSRITDKKVMRSMVIHDQGSKSIQNKEISSDLLTFWQRSARERQKIIKINTKQRQKVRELPASFWHEGNMQETSQVLACKHFVRMFLADFGFTRQGQILFLTNRYHINLINFSLYLQKMLVYKFRVKVVF